MQREVWIAGEPVWIEAMTGQVMGEKKWAETHVHGTGGGGSLYEGTGYISPVKIQSTQTTRHEFWLVGADGKELCISLANSSARVRENQVVTVAWAARQGQQRGPFVLLHNGASGERTWLEPDRSLLRNMGVNDPLSDNRRFLLIAAIIIGVLLLGSHLTLYALCAIVAGSVLLVRLSKSKKAVVAEVKATCSQQVDSEAAGARGFHTGSPSF